MVLQDDAVDEIAGGVGQHESGNPIDSHQQETKRQQASAGANQVPDYGENNPQLLARLPGIARFARGTHLLVRLFLAGRGFILYRFTGQRKVYSGLMR